MDAPTNKIYRGLRLNNLPPELLEHVKRHARMPYDESEVGQHFKIGPVLLDHIENSHHDPELNLGLNWTTNRDFAGKAGSIQTGPCQLGVVLEADLPTNPYAFDPNNNGEDPGNMRSEQQVTPIPGAPLNITGIKLVGWGNGGSGGRDLEVLNDPRYVTRQKEFPSVAQFHTGPQIRIAYLRNKTASRGVPGYNLDDYEPSGRYLTADTIPNQPAPAGWERGVVSFVNPLRLEHLHGGWRQALSAHYDGRTGKELTASLVADGYDGIITADHHGYGEIVAFSPPTYKKLDLKIRYPETIRDPQKDTSDYNFTGSPETQYHHRALDDDDLEDIETRHDSADDWYAEMATRRAQGLPEIDWNTWISQRVSRRLAMAWDEWAPQIKTLGPSKEGTRVGIYYIPHNDNKHEDSQVAFSVRPNNTVFIHGLMTNYNFRNQGVAEALLRRIHQDFPDYKIDPGSMTNDGQGFYDRMLNKEPDARELVTALRLAMAWDEWAPKIQHKYKTIDPAEHPGYQGEQGGTEGRYTIPQAGAFLDYYHYHHRGQDQVAIGGIYVHPENRNDGVAEALMRRLAEDHPGVVIEPGVMTRDGQGFHDRMLEKEPSARELVTAARLAMAWDEWAPKVKHDYDDWLDRSKNRRGYGSLYIQHESPLGLSQVTYYHYPEKKEISIGTLHTEESHRNDGVAEALMRTLHEAYPDHVITPGQMSPDGQAFHDRMLEKEPTARELVTANSLLVGPHDAYDENDWFQRHMDHPPLENLNTADWFHVSPHRMQVGTILAPMHGETPWNDEPYDHGLQNRANWIWIEYDERKAREWQHWVLDHQPECHLYRVKPHLGPFAWNGTADEGWVTDWAEVLEEMT